MNRLEQDAADALEAYEFQQAERERWARAQPAKIVGTWVPTMSEKERQEHEEYVKQHLCPF